MFYFICIFLTLSVSCLSPSDNSSYWTTILFKQITHSIHQDSSIPFKTSLFLKQNDSISLLDVVQQEDIFSDSFLFDIVFKTLSFFMKNTAPEYFSLQDMSLNCYLNLHITVPSDCSIQSLSEYLKLTIFPIISQYKQEKKIGPPSLKRDVLCRLCSYIEKEDNPSLLKIKLFLSQMETIKEQFSLSQVKSVYQQSLLSLKRFSYNRPSNLELLQTHYPFVLYMPPENIKFLLDSSISFDLKQTQSILKWLDKLRTHPAQATFYLKLFFHSLSELLSCEPSLGISLIDKILFNPYFSSDFYTFIEKYLFYVAHKDKILPSIEMFCKIHPLFKNLPSIYLHFIMLESFFYTQENIQKNISLIETTLYLLEQKLSLLDEVSIEAEDYLEKLAFSKLFFSILSSDQFFFEFVQLFRIMCPPITLESSTQFHHALTLFFFSKKRQNAIENFYQDDSTAFQRTLLKFKKSLSCSSFYLPSFYAFYLPSLDLLSHLSFENKLKHFPDLPAPLPKATLSTLPLAA